MKVEILRQHKECPERFANFLRGIGGINPYGKPMFRLVWGESATETIWGQMEGGSCGQHIKLRYKGIPRWNLEMWKPPQAFGTPERWYAESYDPISGYHVCGDFPFEGEYVHHTRLHDLNYRILEELIPKIQEARTITFYQRKKMIEAEMEAEKKERIRIGKDAYMNATPAFGGVAGTYESNREKWTRKYEFPISAEQIKARMGTGHTQFNQGQG